MGNYLLQSYLDASFRAHPERLALVDEQSSVTYAQLQNDAGRMANCLRLNGVQRQDRVVIFMKRSSRVVTSILGVLKADAIYVPLDAKAPIERLLKVINDCQPNVVICDETCRSIIEGVSSQLESVRLLVVFGSSSGSDSQSPCIFWDDVPPPDAQPLPYRNIDTDAAYILYTSGSTGSPKGVTVSHLNVINYIEWAVEYFKIDSEDRILGTAPFYFDMSTFDIFTALKAGATLCVAPERYLLFPNRLLDMIEKERITLWKGVSSLLMYLSTTGCLKEDRIPTLGKILFGGEVLATRHLMNWMNLYPSKQFYNVYGPTETTGISACFPVERAPESANQSIPIGKACANTEIFVLNDEDRRAAIGETGELCIRGSGLSLGYWNDEAKTARAFVKNPLGCTQNDRIYRTGDLGRLTEQGDLEYLGRRDFQVKFMGYRIELYEIEQAILSFENIHQAAVLLCNSSLSEVPELVAFIAGQDLMNLESLMEDLSRAVPSYMLPRRIIQLEQIPLTDRGKTDRAALQGFYLRDQNTSGKGDYQ